jgi:uncharacterized membrane protein
VSNDALVFESNDDERMDGYIGHLLRIGMLTSAAIILVGGVLYLVQHGHDPANFSHFSGISPSLRSLSGIVHNAFHGDSASIIQFGLLVLIATPIARVIFTVIAFAAKRDLMYVVISVLVLGVLLYSLFVH